jgi:hypothetical protein
MTFSLIYVVKTDALRIQPTYVSISESAPYQDFSVQGGTEPYSFEAYDVDNNPGFGSVAQIADGVRYTPDGGVGSGLLIVTDSSVPAVQATASFFVFNTTDLLLEPSSQPLVQGETIDITPTGGDGSYNPITIDSADPAQGDFGFYDLASPTPRGTVDQGALEYTAGNSIGKVHLVLEDGVNPPATLILTILPAKPQSFVASGDTGDNQSIQLSWAYTKPGIDGFRVFRSESSAGFVEIADSPLAPTATGYLDTGLNPAKGYEYYIRAFVANPLGGEYLSPVDLDASDGTSDIRQATPK